MQVTIVGAGMSGAACAVALHRAGVDIRILDRARAPGGRMASPQLHGRRVDLGAAYLTVRDAGFAEVVDGWRERGLAREWTSSFDVLSSQGRSCADGTVRWSAPGGLRSLVRDLLGEIPVETAHDVTDMGRDLPDSDTIVLAMPDPQAARVARDAVQWVDYEPVIAVAAGWRRRCWSLDAAAFVDDDPDITLIADDGSRRGDDAPVLVVHTTAELAGRHQSEPAGALGPALAATRRLLGLPDEPEWAHAHRWTFAKPAGTHGEQRFALTHFEGRLLGICGDSWSPSGPPRVESAWLSGTRLGVELAARPGAVD